MSRTIFEIYQKNSYFRKKCYPTDTQTNPEVSQSALEIFIKPSKRVSINYTIAKPSFFLEVLMGMEIVRTWMF